MRTFLHFVRYLVGIDPPSTQVAVEEHQELVRLARDVQVVVELGCFEGATTLLLAQATNGVVHTVDPFYAGRLGVCWGQLIAERQVSTLPPGKVFIHRMLSWEAAELVDAVDLLFIDADHSLESIRKDWEAWVPRVRPGGHIALHDSLLAANSRNHLGSMQFYEDVVKSDGRVRVVAEVGCMAVVVRVGP